MSLDLIKKENISRKIKKEFRYAFSVEQSGIYTIIVSARAKSWFQNIRKFISFFSDDNLALVFSRTTNLKPAFNYIEFWADRMPIFNELNIRVTMSNRIPSVDDPEWTGNFYDDSEEMILARLIFGEARGQSEEARSWVAKVVLNRKESKAWPDTIHDVILDSGQFDPFKPTDKKNYPRIIDPLVLLIESTAWEECYRIAERAVNGNLDFDTEATHFHSYTEPEDIKRFEQKIVPNGKFLKKINDIYFYWSPN